MFLLILGAIVLAMFYGEVTAEPPESLALTPTLVSVAILTLLGIVPGLVLWRWFRPRAGVDIQQRIRLMQRYRRGLWLYRGMLLGLFAFQIYGLHWPYIVDHVLHLEAWVLVNKIAYLAPFLVALLLSWIPLFFLERALRQTPLTFRRYVEFQLRHYVVFLLAPWLVYVTLFEVVERYVPGAYTLLAENVLLQYLLAVGLLLGIYVLWPLAIRFIWSTSSLPQGDLRRRLEELCLRCKIRYRDILLWHTPGWALVNACVTGIWGRFRYILLTTELAHNLTEDEIETVFAHEIGHVKKHHMLFYLVFALSFIYVLIAAFVLGQALLEVSKNLLAGLGQGWLAGLVNGTEQLWSDTNSVGIADVLFVLLVVALYWGLGFGYLSRRLESEADIFAVQVTGNLDAFLAALEKIAFLNGLTRSFRSWRHFSIARRVALLQSFALNPAKEARFQRRLRWLRWGLVVFLSISISVVLAASLR